MAVFSGIGRPGNRRGECVSFRSVQKLLYETRFFFLLKELWFYVVWDTAEDLRGLEFPSFSFPEDEQDKSVQALCSPSVSTYWIGFICTGLYVLQ